ncbi:stalk domain-containing protein [Paenibacillus mendelii]|nr:stalk domain-containing protein [Paenibacillus mendelii]
MKKTVMLTVLAAALSTSAAGVGSAASVTHSEAQPVTMFINDAAASIRALSYNGATLISVRDLGTAAGAWFEVGANSSVNVYYEGHTIQLTSFSSTVLVDGEQVQLTSPVVNVKNSLYIDLAGFLAALGIERSVDSQGQVRIDATKLLQDVEHPVWMNNGTLIVSQLTEEGRVDYTLDAKTGAFAELLRSTGTSSLTIVSGGGKAAYTDENGAIFVIDLVSKAASQVSGDSSIKPELVWSEDSTAIYFLQGDKGSVIAKLNLADGKISKVLEDKVDYKSNLAVSADGKTFVYTVTKPGAVTADGSKPVESDDVAIDMTGTEPQVYLFDSSSKEAKASQLTSSTDDKIFVGLSSDGGKAFYISMAENNPSALVAVAKDKTVTTLVGDKDVLQAALLGDKLIVLTAESNGQAIYEVDAAAGTTKLVYHVSDEVSEVIAAAGAPIAIVQGGQVLIDNNGQWKKVSK